MLYHFSWPLNAQLELHVGACPPKRRPLPTRPRMARHCSRSPASRHDLLGIIEPRRRAGEGEKGRLCHVLILPIT